MGFQHFVHDAEHTLLNVNENRLGPYNAGRSFTYFNPQYLWQRLQANEEFTLLIGDRIHRHLFNDGALTTEKATELFLRRKDQIDRAVVAESARWGDSARAPGLLLVTESGFLPLTPCSTVLSRAVPGFFAINSSRGIFTLIPRLPFSINLGSGP